MLDPVAAFKARYGGQPDEVAQEAGWSLHRHLASDIEGAFSNVTVTGDIWGNWDGVLPADLSTTYDASASTGFMLDSSAGAAQFMGDFYIGGDFRLITGGSIATAASGARVSLATGVKASTVEIYSGDAAEVVASYIKADPNEMTLAVWEGAANNAASIVLAQLESGNAGRILLNPGWYDDLSASGKVVIGGIYPGGGLEVWPAGTTTLPAVRGLDTNTGLYFPVADSLGFVAGGVELLRLTEDTTDQILLGVAGTATVPALTWIADTDTGLSNTSADTLDLVAGGVQMLSLVESVYDTAYVKVSLDVAGDQYSNWNGTVPIDLTSAFDSPEWVVGDAAAAVRTDNQGNTWTLTNDATIVAGSSLDLPGVNGSADSGYTTANTGEITYWARIRADDYSPAANYAIVGQYNNDAAGNSFFRLITTGHLSLYRVIGGAGAGALSSTVTLGSVGATDATTDIWVWCHHVSSTGVTKFYYATTSTNDEPTAWASATQLGATVDASSGARDASTYAHKVGITGTTANDFFGTIYSAGMCAGPPGTAPAYNPRFYDTAARTGIVFDGSDGSGQFTGDFHVGGNLSIGPTGFGTSAAKVLGIANGTVPSTSPADMIQLFSVDISAGNASLGLRTETAVVVAVAVQDRYLNIKINGTTYKLLLAA